MEATMSNRTIKHEVKLQPVVIILLAVLAIGVCANAFSPVFSVKDARADTREIEDNLSRIEVAIYGIAACRM